jgi:hypothetical protein
MTDYKKKRGERLGFNWFMPAIAGKRAIRHVVFDTNFWKSFIHSRLGVAMGDAGNLSLYGRNALHHQIFAEHLTAEYRVKTEGMGRTVDEWKLRPERGDNHWLDCVAGCAVCASMLGSELPEQYHLAKSKEKKHLSEIQKNKGIELKDEIINPLPPVQEKKRLRLSDIQRQKGY